GRGANAKPEVMIARDLRFDAIDIDFARKLIGNVVTQIHDQCRGCSTGYTKRSTRSLRIRRVVGRAVRERVVEHIDGSTSGRAIIRNVREIDAGKACTELERVHAADVVDYVVVSLHRAFGRIDRGEIDSVTVVAVNQVVMHVQIKLI